MRKILVRALVSGIGSCVGYRVATAICNKLSDPVTKARIKRKFSRIKDAVIEK